MKRQSDLNEKLTLLTLEIKALQKTYSEVLHVIERLEKAGLYDDLTGLYRRRPFLSRLQNWIQECKAQDETCGVLMVDIDHFKKINDTYGHSTGDQVIARVSQLLKKFENDTTFVGRLGGEEFAVAIRGSTPQILATGEWMRREAERLHGPVFNSDGTPSDIEWKCTLSVGVATSDQFGYQASLLLSQSDKALYKAKKGGRNQVQAA
jgi:diguanylate cyclase (GGDEF)-like protein